MKGKLINFVKENGFLLFLFVCVCIVAISTIMVITKDPNTLTGKNDPGIVDNNQDGNLDGENSEEVSYKPKEKQENPKDKEVLAENLEEGMDKNKEENPKEKIENPDEEKKEEVEEKKEGGEVKNPKQEEKTGNKTSFLLPISGDVITEFTTDNLIYSKTLDEWRAHPGIDIKGESGTKVKAAASGTIKEAYDDPLWGNVVVIDHGNGLLTKYANLGTKDMVKPGLKVNQGDEIGTIGKSAGIEMLMDSHLHFEAIKDGKNVDPRSIK